VLHLEDGSIILDEQLNDISSKQTFVFVRFYPIKSESLNETIKLQLKEISFMKFNKENEQFMEYKLPR
jgi:hypothetical protein